MDVRDFRAEVGCNVRVCTTSRIPVPTNARMSTTPSAYPYTNVRAGEERLLLGREGAGCGGFCDVSGHGVCLV